MGGFQKYPIPRRIRRDYFSYNPRWRQALSHVLLQGLMATLAGYRAACLTFY
jgi:hypothetical protein